MSGYYYKYTVINDPLAVDETTANGINDSGQIVGIYTDSSSTAHGFLYSNETFTTLDDPLGINGTTPIGINAAGEIVGSYLDASDVTHGFLYSNGTYTPLDYPGATGTVATGIN